MLLIKFLWKFLELGLTQQTKVYEWWSYIKCWLIKYKEELEDFSKCMLKVSRNHIWKGYYQNIKRMRGKLIKYSLDWDTSFMIQWSCFINDTSQSYTAFCIVPSLQSIKYWQSVTLLYLDWTNTLSPLISFIILCFQEIRKLVSRTSDESPEYSQWVKRQSFQK